MAAESSPEVPGKANAGASAEFDTGASAELDTGASAKLDTHGRERNFPWRLLIPIGVLLVGLGWLALEVPRIEVERLREELERELNEGSTRADVVALAGTPSNSISVTDDDGTVVRESLSWGPGRTWLSQAGAWVSHNVLGKPTLRMSMPMFEVRWFAGRCLGVCEPGSTWPDNEPGLQWPVVDR